MDMITHILAVAVALLAAVCLKLCHTIDFKNKRLVKFINENIDLKDAIMDMKLEIQRSNEVIRALRDRQDDSGKDSPKGVPVKPTDDVDVDKEYQLIPLDSL